MKHQRLQKATESQSIDLNLLASTPIHDRLTFERAQAVEEKMAERSRRNGACVGKTYQGWMAEIDRQVAHHERTGSEKQSQSQSHSLFSSSSSSSLASSSATTVPKKRGRQPSLDRCVWALSGVAFDIPFDEVVNLLGEALMPKARARLYREEDGYLERGTRLPPLNQHQVVIPIRLTLNSD